MELAAKIIADHIKSLGITINNSNFNARNKEERKAYGDLAEKLIFGMVASVKKLS